MVRPLLLPICFLLLQAAPPESAYHAGATTRLIHPREARNWRGAKTQALFTRIWYPVDPRVPETIHPSGSRRDAVFETHPTALDAPLSAAHPTYPLLLISHGFGGNAAGMEWLGVQLAAHGYIAAAPNHPGNNSRDMTLAGAILWWERATDLSDVLDAMLQDPQFGQHIHPKRIGAVGYSMGGYTVLELAGARTDREAFFRYCRSPEARGACSPSEMPGVLQREKQLERDPTAQSSLARSGDSYRDPRIRAVFAIAPGLGEAFTPAGLKDVTIPVEILAGAADQVAPVASNAERFARFLPSCRLKILPGGVGHYTFLDTCTPLGKQILPEYCDDAPGVNRASVHAQAIADVIAFFPPALP